MTFSICLAHSKLYQDVNSTHKHTQRDVAVLFFRTALQLHNNESTVSFIKNLLIGHFHRGLRQSDNDSSAQLNRFFVTMGVVQNKNRE